MLYGVNCFCQEGAITVQKFCTFTLDSKIRLFRDCVASSVIVEAITVLEVAVGKVTLLSFI